MTSHLFQEVEYLTVYYPTKKVMGDQESDKRRLEIPNKPLLRLYLVTQALLAD